MDRTLSWALVIATYNRQNILPQCLRLAAAQTCPPSQIIVVDSSDDWQETHDRVMTEIAVNYPAINWIYAEATERSSASQRNQGARLSNADVLFMIDDDSLMYPDCAEQIMRIYEADVRRKIVGVAALPVAQEPPKTPTKVTPKTRVLPSSTRAKGLSLKQLVRRWLKADERFIPYDEDFPRLPLPEEVKHLPVGTRILMGGFSMTWRREIVLQEPFEERMKKYASGEDSDMSYRASRHGALATAFDAWLYHAEAPGGRLSPYIKTAMGTINPLMMHRIYSTNLERSRVRNRALLRRRLLIEFLKDLTAKDFSLSQSRGILFGLQHVNCILNSPLDSVDSLYERLQNQLFSKLK